MNPYRSAQWRAFRREVITLDKGACNRCAKSEVDGAVLQVHHKRYLAGRKPWEYPLNLCEALCQGCHAVEHGIIPPTSGWEFIGCDDLGDLSGSCDYCHTEIRHVFMVQHPKWATMEVGTDCCDRLTATDEASSYMVAVRKRNDRRKRFVSSPRWVHEAEHRHAIEQTTAGGWRKVPIKIHTSGGVFWIAVYGKVGNQRFTSLALAKGAVFDACESGKMDAWLKRLFGKKR